jgi:UDP-4-amino-4,6-dideoxy-N-acetyl-beta-L-altrosamine N-acetyltransferase
MIISKYGIELHRLQKNEDIELVRIMRNSEPVQRGMFFREPITPEMQQNWFASQNNKYNYHFLICFQGKKIGMISGKNVDFINRTSEGGIFIWDTDMLGSPVPVIASVIMAELSFNLLNLEKTYAEARKDNPVALRYNRLLGYEVLQEIHPEQKVMMVLSRNNFMSGGLKFLNTIRKLTKDPYDLTWNDIHFNDVSDEDRARLYTGFPKGLQENINGRFK